MLREMIRMGRWRKVSKWDKGKRRWLSGSKEGEDREPSFSERKSKKALGAVPASELQETSVEAAAWRDASCPPYTQ